MSTKRDLNTIVKIEKAIKEKYGEESVVNPKNLWTEDKEKEYLKQCKKLSQKEFKKKDLEEKIEVDGFFVSKRLISDSNRICPICDEFSFKIEDDIYMIKYECCYKCFIEYIEGREDRWKNGWRPSVNKDIKGEDK